MACLFLVGAGVLTPAAGVAAETREARGLVRLAHLSPDAPAVDVYLYAVGNETPRLVLRHVGYGALSPYQRLVAGRYTVAMRPADAPASSRPVLSTAVLVRGGAAYTVAGMGPYKGLRLVVLNDTAAVPDDRAGLRVIAASLKEPAVDVTANGASLVESLRFPAATSYRHLATGTAEVGVQGRGSTAKTEIGLRAGMVHTVVVLDGERGLRLVALRDAAPGAVPPGGGAGAGFGGSAGGERVESRSLWPMIVLGVLSLVGMAVVRPVRGAFLRSFKRS
ncbi:uncharacterized protein DUF4397 [Thermomonospora umbrina]|uniref:Uncharacterized protein DUF4397 n=2 Tax=Thermomonospora umbrina TaxID=111806 RepID=A0A3D9SNE1_9ACTN|nr:uncharacterized protein DUF4397 [Thermomonospora umbrina]